tara:strand:+ start:56029 stop:56673 length:645 start_codon:yes stop_codon:yes gene_type:complete
MTNSDYVVNRIKQGVSEGHYAPGQRLIEADLVLELGVKRGHVREALRILAGEGIVEIVPQRGARVRKLTEKDIAEMMPVLGGLLGVTVDLAIDKVGKQPFRQRLEKLMRELRQQAKSGNALGFHHASGAYHEVLAEAASNPFLDYLNEKIHGDLFRAQFIGTVKIGNWDRYLAHFQDMHDALMAGDNETARRLIMDHQTVLLHGGYENALEETA